MLINKYREINSMRSDPNPAFSVRLDPNLYFFLWYWIRISPFLDGRIWIHFFPEGRFRIRSIFYYNRFYLLLSPFIEFCCCDADFLSVSLVTCLLRSFLICHLSASLFPYLSIVSILWTACPWSLLKKL